jgi:polyferredoxin/Pyruvate/2-oxoacid:ferredoxin oxidoreductase delta subunit
VRRLVQSLAFAAFLAFIVGLPAMAGTPVGGDWLMRFSPWSGLCAMVASWQLMVRFWPALVLLVAAVVLGRYFCGWLCPLGATLDLGDGFIRWLRGRRRGAAPPAERPDYEDVPGRRAKYYVLTACVVGAFLGLSFYGLLDPLSIAARSFVLVVHSYVSQGAVAALGALGPAGATQAARSALAAGSEPAFQLHGVTLAVLVGLLALGLVRRRFWCRYLCPLGAMYALAGKPAVARRSVTDACIQCGRCADACPMGCISPDGRRTLNDECILCLQCQAVCPVSAVRFFSPTPPGQAEEVDLTRRGALVAAAAGAAAYPLLRMRRSWLGAKGDPLIRPPLAGRDSQEFLSKCLRCAQCMRACPTQVIQPAGLEAGLESLWTPQVAPRPGYCEYNCDLCGKACPSGAIPRFTLDEKHAAAIGLAYVDRARCIPWRGNERWGEKGFVADAFNCGVCEEVCPVPGKAIHFRRVQGPEGSQELRLPYVRAEACVGCGYCQAVCPVEGQAAIRVTGGYRQLAAAAAVAEAVVPTAAALPVSSGPLRLAGPKTTYAGPTELFDYIDGGADPYLAFHFVRVTAAEYTDGQSSVKVDLWEFQTGDDAFGAFAKDRRGEALDLGDEGAVLQGSVWGRRGRFMTGVLNLEGAPLDAVKGLARTALANLNEPAAPWPAICRRLPADWLDRMSVVFMRDEKPLYSVRLADNFIPDEVWAFAEGAVGACGAYPLPGAKKPALLLLIEYGTAGEAVAAAGRLADLRAGWGEEKAAERPYAAFRAGEGDCCVIGSSGRLFAAAFHAASPEAGTSLVAAALK